MPRCAAATVGTYGPSAATGSDSCGMQVVRVDSADAVTIRILPNGATYSSDVKRLRKAVPTSAPPFISASPRIVGTSAHRRASSAPPFISASSALDVAALERALAAKFSHVSRSVRLNPHAQPGTPLHQRFVDAAAAAADSKVVDVMLHGTPEANIDSILQTSLRGRACGTCWFTDDHNTASSYADSASRMIAFAVLRNKNDTNNIITTQHPAHHLPLFELQRAQ